MESTKSPLEYPRIMGVTFTTGAAALITREASLVDERLCVEKCHLDVLIKKDVTDNGWATIDFSYNDVDFQAIGDVRYENVFFFPRGPFDVAAQAFKNSMIALEQIKTLSSGTLSTISGQTHYQVIDNIRVQFEKKIKKDIKNGKDFMNWQDAWSAFRESSEYHETLAF